MAAPVRWRLILVYASLAMLSQAALNISAAQAQSPQLFSQAASASLEQQFGNSELSWYLLDDTGRVLSQHWDRPETPISPGSLVKPFLALAYGEQHGFVYPHVFCAGTKSRCWLPRGHGSIGIEHAIGSSCNAYFLALANALDRTRAIATFQQLGLTGPPQDGSADALIGLGDQWKETPLALAHAYLALMHQASRSKEPIVKGMAIAASSGTAQSVDQALGTDAAIAKTGTAVCSHHPRGAADGFALVLFPSAQPRLLLLLRLHGATGAQTAAVAGQMLHSIGQGN